MKFIWFCPECHNALSEERNSYCYTCGATVIRASLVIKDGRSKIKERENKVDRSDPF